ncbi:MAG: flippase [Anaerolineae bacterium]|nr:flippase [Anaerolineae bacterium]
MQRWRSDLMLAGILLLLPILLFAPVVLGNKTLLPADILYGFQPYKTGAESLGVTLPHNALLADLILENYPWKQFLVDALKTWSLPLWDPYLFTGHPFLANGQHSALYPLTWIFFVLPISRAFGVFITLQLGLAGVSMYILGRVIGAGRHGGFLAGIVFQFSGFMVASAVHPMIVAAAAWLPLLLAFVDLTVRRARFLEQDRAMLPWALLGAGVLGMQVLAGHAEITYFVLLVIVAFAAWRLLYTMCTHPRSVWLAEVGTPMIGIMLILVLGLSLGAIQLVPLYEIVRQSFRQGAVSLSDVLGWSYPKRRLLAFLIPNFFGNPAHHTLWDFFNRQTLSATVDAYGNSITAYDWGIKNYVEGAAYVGILPLLLTLLAIIKPPNFPSINNNLQLTHDRFGLISVRKWLLHPYIPFFTALSLFSLGCIFGTPLYAVVYVLPFISQSHSPFRWVFPLTVAVAALAGLGAATLAESRKSPASQSAIPNSQSKSHFMFRVLRLFIFDTTLDFVSIIAALAIWSGALMLGGLWASRLLFDYIEPLVEKTFWALAKAPNAFPDHRAFYAYLFPWIQIAGIWMLSSGIVLRVSRCPIYLPGRRQKQTSGRISTSIFRGRPVWELLAIGVLLIDLLIFGTGFNPAIDPKLLTYTPPVVDFLREDTSLWRFSTFDPQGKKTMNANTGMFYGFQDVRGYDSLFTAQYARYMGWIEPQGALPYNRIAPFTQFSSLDSPLTDLLNVKYMITEEEIPLPKYKLVYQDSAVRVYENLGVTPRAFTLPATATVLVSDTASSLNGAAMGETVLHYDPRFYALIEQNEEAWIGPARRAWHVPLYPEPATPVAQPVTQYTANEVLISVTVDQPSWLILSDAYFPGWKAFVRPPGTDEGAETEVAIARVAGNFRGVFLDESAVVRFKYSPNSVKFGIFISFLSGMIMVLLAVVWTWRLRHCGQEDTSTVQRLAKNSITPILLTTFNRIIEFAFAALMLRILGPANAGDYYLAVNVFIWFDILTNFGLNTYLTREVSRDRDQARRYLLNTTVIRLVLGGVALPLLAGFIFVRQTIVAELTFPASAQAIWAIVLLYAGLIPNSISTGLTALFYAYEKAEYPALITTVSTLCKVVMQTLVLLAGWGIIGLAASAIGVNLITLAILGVLAAHQFSALREARNFHLRDASERLLRREMVAESWLLMVNHFLATLFFKVDVFIVEAIQGSDALGRYSIGYKLLDALNIVPAMFTMALFPVISRQARDDRERFVRFYRLGIKILVALALPAALLTTVAAREMVLVLAGQEYVQGAMFALQLMAWSMPIGWVNSLTQYVLIALDQQRYLIRAYSFSFVFTLIANLFFVPRFNYQVSALLHIISEMILLIFFTIGIRKKLGADMYIYDVRWRDVVGKPILAILIASGVVLALWPIHRWAAFVGAVIVYPLVAWYIGVLTPEERKILTPLFRKS